MNLHLLGESPLRTLCISSAGAMPEGAWLVEHKLMMRYLGIGFASLPPGPMPDAYARRDKLRPRFAFDLAKHADPTWHALCLQDDAMRVPYRRAMQARDLRIIDARLAMLDLKLEAQKARDHTAPLTVGDCRALQGRARLDHTRMPPARVLVQDGAKARWCRADAAPANAIVLRVAHSEPVRPYFASAEAQRIDRAWIRANAAKKMRRAP